MTRDWDFLFVCHDLNYCNLKDSAKIKIPRTEIVENVEIYCFSHFYFILLVSSILQYAHILYKIEYLLSRC